MTIYCSTAGKELPPLWCSVAERHVGAVTDCFAETPKDSSLQSLLSPIALAIIILFTYFLTYLKITIRSFW